MRLVVADTGPINYLILIEKIDLLPILFKNVILPSAVQTELIDPDARHWCGGGLTILRLGSTYTKRRPFLRATNPPKDSMKGRKLQLL